MLNALDIHVTGIVQGVGFRPFVYRLAKRYLVNGWVLNAIDGVHIHAEGDEQLVDEFIMDMHDNPPAAARIERIDMKEVPLEGFDTFEIRISQDNTTEDSTLVSPDLATCEDCLSELFDRDNRRFHYPFINCTNCGPRFTIIDSLPYDRPHTSMAQFEMCDTCAAEYANPEDRRFHAQPDACFECGPHLYSVVLSKDENVDEAALADSSTIGETSLKWGTTQEESDAVIAQAVEALQHGKIVAVKGLGGFQLLCDAANAEALRALRVRKKRDRKPFAVLLQDVAAAKQYCKVSPEEEALITSPARPIVLLKKHTDAVFAKGLADRLPELGVMLPATPLQHLLVRSFGGMLVCTSGNVHDEPIQTDDDAARVALAGIADILLGNDRPIRSRYDDSVVRVLDFGEGETAVQFIRRARGYSPLPLSCETSSPNCIFATGPEQKNTFCFLQDGKAFVSQHIGDMENVQTFDAWLESKHTYEHLFDLHPQRVACDSHPEYLASKWAHDQELPVVQVQHHHAHIVSAMAEHGVKGPVCGIAFDGTGYGADGAIWGGEVLLSNLGAYERFANFAYFPLPGGAAAIKHPLRAAYGALWAFDLLEHPAAAHVLETLGDEAAVCERMVDAGLNTPYTSSVGRLFDVAAAILGICTEPTYEGEGAVLLEAALWSVQPPASKASDVTPLGADSTAPSYTIDIVKNTATEGSTAQDTSVVLLDAAPLFKAMLDDMEAGREIPDIVQRFHDAFVGVIVQMSQLVEAAYDMNTVVLAGGVFMNRYLCERVVPALVQAGFSVVMNKDLPPNDGGLSLGQAVIAANA